MRGSTSDKVCVVCEVKKTTELLCSLPLLFGDTLSCHMKRLNVSNETLAELLGISSRQVTRMRNSRTTIPKLSFVVAICICLHLEPELSEDLVSKSGQHFLPIEEHVFYKYILRNMYMDSIDACNQMLKNSGYPILCQQNQKSWECIDKFPAVQASLGETFQ